MTELVDRSTRAKIEDLLRYAPLTFPKGIFKARSKTNLIVIHSLDTPPDWKEDIRQIDRWHREERGWAAIGYHYVIFRDGTVVTGRPLDVIGAHQPGWNSRSVAIALAGGKGAKREDEDFFEHYTLDQETSLDRMLNALRRLWPAVQVVGHRDHPKCEKACPGFDVKVWAHG